MKEVLRNTLAAMAGAVTGVIVIALIQLLSMKLYPPPPGLDFQDKAAMAEHMRTLPVGALLIVLCSYLVGVFAGGFVAGKLSLTFPVRQVFLIMVLFLVASLMNLFSLPHPAWFWVANFAVVIAGGWLAMKVTHRPAPGGPS